ncbi:MAG: recombination mediator RecR [Patescibacteria group bacterium]
MRPEPIEKIIRIFSRFPGIGQRQAARFAYFLVNAEKSTLKNLKNLLEELESVKHCLICFKIHALKNKDICPICSDGARDKNRIAVVEKELDLEAIEKSGVYNGSYHILGGLLSALDAGNRDRLRLRELLDRIKKNSGIKEIILALSATAEGEFSARYIEKILEPFKKERNLSVTRLGRGLASGTEVEYLNAETIKHAWDSRKQH